MPMRREHLSILTGVLDAMAACTDEHPGGLHITAVAARANLPHDRLKHYLSELADAGLVWRDWPCTPTAKGRQFLDCYHAWQRLQVLFGLGKAAANASVGHAVLASRAPLLGPDPLAPPAGSPPPSPAPVPVSGASGAPAALR